METGDAQWRDAYLLDISRDIYAAGVIFERLAHARRYCPSAAGLNAAA